jgi:protein-tyrosine-phosphatase
MHPHAVRVLRETVGIDISGRRPQNLDTLAGHRFDHVVTLCDKARETCPEFAHHPRRAHWSIPDPAGADSAGYPAFQRIAADIDTRVRHLLPVLTAADRQKVQP